MGEHPNHHLHRDRRVWQRFQCLPRAVRITDTLPPVAVETPDNVVVSCEESLPSDAPVFEESCSIAEVMLVENTEIGACTGESNLIQVWTATDACGNAATVSRTIAIVDTTAPAILTPTRRLWFFTNQDNLSAQKPFPWPT